MKPRMKQRRVLGIASSGGHWVQLYRLRPAWDGCAVTYVTNDTSYQEKVNRDAADRGQREPRFHVVVEASRWNVLRIIRLFAELTIIFFRSWPDVVISTGAAPGCVAIILGRIFGARTVWIESIAHADKASLSAILVRPFADIWLSQWEDLARSDGPQYWGRVI